MVLGGPWARWAVGSVLGAWGLQPGLSEGMERGHVRMSHKGDRLISCCSVHSGAATLRRLVDKLQDTVRLGKETVYTLPHPHRKTAGPPASRPLLPPLPSPPLRLPQSKYLGMTLSLPDIDTYFIISCTNAPDASNPPRPARPPKAPKAPARPPLWGWREGEEGRAGVEAGVSLGAEAGAEVEAGVEVDVDGGAGQEWQGVAAGREGEVGAGGAGVGGEVAGWEEATGEAGREELERGGGQGRKGLGGRGGAAGS